MLELIKEREKLKEELKELSSKYKAIKEPREKEFINNVIQTFNNFFKEKEFIISNLNNDIKATYGSYEVILKNPHNQEPRIGCKLFFELIKEKVLYNIPVFLNDNTRKSNSYSYASNDEKAKLNGEIKSLKNDIDWYQQQLNDYPTQIYTFGCNLEKDRGGAEMNKRYSSFEEILKLIFS